MDVGPEQQLRRMRTSIDNLDAALVFVLAERFRQTDEVGVLKATHKLPPVDSSREEAQMQRIHRLAESAGLDPAIAERVLRAVISEVIERHVATARSHG